MYTNTELDCEWLRNWGCLVLRRSLADSKLWGGSARIPSNLVFGRDGLYRYVAKDRFKRLWSEEGEPRHTLQAQGLNTFCGNLELEDCFSKKSERPCGRTE